MCAGQHALPQSGRPVNLCRPCESHATPSPAVASTCAHARGLPPRGRARRTRCRGHDRATAPQTARVQQASLITAVGGRPDRFLMSDVPGPVNNAEIVRVGLGGDGSVRTVTADQRLELTGEGDYAVRERGPARSARPRCPPHPRPPHRGRAPSPLGQGHLHRHSGYDEPRRRPYPFGGNRAPGTSSRRASSPSQVPVRLSVGAVASPSGRSAR